ncbi:MULTISPECIES: prepilin-type N-terminal cleavage/methylation domain-containing protein [unclassified Pseudoalteromonas]|uniref:prepilin-type N-terminal cleavage/methylation domain-containing protein n=1 Tax=unclassified Pseudoalteromonas TaxID=194690 RepID=UPI0013FD5384|nr:MULTISPECIES: prepilin-type N-terminal cleavage/methylation domain-containing protein [unclassified Pseudoalteromonas]MBH0027146.1 prepilin-type N-terminal cleavage/methylation domain-containing protein [Pseudoalteromonas sp. SWN29]MBH0041979.1 prepilin-type N-terminal cleavage/methylation domain-containing protein [Pseudoalteromonas sp. SWXJZ10B]MBH0074503.1 prepilin-type N-terminal cleavage/methylation domain-containing protein [Pseudoalteromonas sp. SWYJ118]
MLKNRNKGFSLLEVMIALIIATVALLGLASGQLKSLQYITNSFNYTVSIIEANNVLERIWPHLCELQQTNPDLYNDADFRAYLSPQIDAYTLILPADFSNDLTVEITWQDKRLTDNLENRVVITGSFPTLPAGCVP